MKLTPLLLSAFLGCAALLVRAEPERTPENLGEQKTIQNLNHILVQNTRGENLGRVRGVNLDLANGRIVEVFVVTGDVLGFGGKTIAVPPALLVTQPDRGIFYLNAADGKFQSARKVDISRNGDSRSGPRIAANARHFGVEPYFLEDGDTADRNAARPKTRLGYVERASRIIGLPVGNLQNEPFGKVSAINFDISKGLIQSVVVRAPGFTRSSSILPPGAFAFNAAHNALILDATKREFTNEPLIVVTDPANAQPANSQEEPFNTENPPSVVVQGDSYADIDLAASISRRIRAAKIKGLSVQVTTRDGRTVLRGSAPDASARDRAAQIAVAASRIEVVDNQIAVNTPAANR
jgi:sporulation protein YlmC with PRC-barrel domain